MRGTSGQRSWDIYLYRGIRFARNINTRSRFISHCRQLRLLDFHIHFASYTRFIGYGYLRHRRLNLYRSRNRLFFIKKCRFHRFRPSGHRIPHRGIILLPRFFQESGKLFVCFILKFFIFFLLFLLKSIKLLLIVHVLCCDNGRYQKK